MALFNKCLTVPPTSSNIVSREGLISALNRGPGMGAVRLGKNHLRWCDACNLPVLEDRECGRCGGPTKAVDVTPPADSRPAFAHNIKVLRATVDAQFGPGCGDALLESGRVVIMNKVPALDRMDEVIIDGEVVGALRYDMGKGWRFIARMGAAHAIAEKITRSLVICDKGAVRFVRDKKNLMAPGVVDADPAIVYGDEVVVLDTDGEAICSGIARMGGQEMVDSAKGLSVKNRWTDRGPRPRPRAGATWEEAFEANTPMLDRRIGRSSRFIRNVIDEHQLPAVVSFSGGKDSLATWILTKEAGLDLPLLFIDTGLEFNETLEYVRRFAETHDLKVIMELDREDTFLRNVSLFGPPGRDHRWCCKTNKLGPTVRAITRHFPDGVLSFIGQRRYESASRAAKPNVWRNPWVPGQVGASPIQEWTQLHVWLLILSRGVEYNTWYDRGLDRIGCFVCPASDMAELELVKEGCDRYADWEDRLRSYAEERGIPKEWIDFDLWRWRDVPESVLNEMSDMLPPARAAEVMEKVRNIDDGLSMTVDEDGVSAILSRKVDMSAAANLANMLGEVVAFEDDFTVIGVEVRSDGCKVINPSADGLEKVHKVMVKADSCVGCGLCITRCPEGALALIEGRVRVDEGRCVHCGDCLDPCPALTFGLSDFEL